MSNLYIVSTPIGNLQDITIRAISVLFEVDIIVAENVSTGSKLLFHIKNKYPQFLTSHISPKLISMNEFEEELKIPEIVQDLQNGKSVALISEAGTPLLSDPGFKLVRETHKKGISVISIPGVSSITSALSISGLPTDKFLFVGFPPKSAGKRKTFFSKLKSSIEVLESNNLSSTAIFFESPHRLIETLQIFQEIFGDIQISLAHELTKIHESITNKLISEHISQFKTAEPKGEFVVLFAINE